MSNPHFIIFVLFVWSLGATGTCLWLAFKLDETMDRIEWLTFDKNYLKRKLEQKGDQQ